MKTFKHQDIEFVLDSLRRIGEIELYFDDENTRLAVEFITD